jgi:hyaluronan synthase
VSKQSKKNLSRIKLGKLLSYLFNITLVVLVLFLLILTKTRGAAYFFANPLLYVYTTFLTIFRLSRVGASLFYRHADDKTKELKQFAHYEPSVTFVVPCKNEEAAIYKTVQKCFESNYPKEKIEVIVINDGSTDGTAAVLEKAKADYHQLVVVDWKINQGKRHAMAEGFKRAKGDIVVQLDSDSYVEPKTLPYLVEYFNNPTVGAVCAHAYIENADQNLLTRMQSAHYYVAFRISKAAESIFSTVFCCSGCSSAYRKDLILPILDEWLKEEFLGAPVTWGDDRALTNQVLKKGFKTVYTDKARSMTIAPSTWRQFLKQQIRWKKGWFVNSFFVNRFIYKTQPFVAFTYFLPLTITTTISPVIALKVFLYDYIVHGISPLYYIVGSLLVNCIITLYYRVLAPEDKYWPYTFAWSFLNMFFLSYILFYALATIQNRKWGTR